MVTVFGMGYGPMSPPPADGTAPCTTSSKPVVDISVFVSSAFDPPLSNPAVIQYLGNAPCLVSGWSKSDPEAEARSPCDEPARD
jgi:hypothetical protein